MFISWLSFSFSFMKFIILNWQILSIIFSFNQDHNYGAPPPPTPPSYSPCASPAHANGVPDEDTNLSIVSTSTANEETQERSITRCIWWVVFLINHIIFDYQRKCNFYNMWCIGASRIVKENLSWVNWWRIKFRIGCTFNFT